MSNAASASARVVWSAGEHYTLCSTRSHLHYTSKFNLISKLSNTQRGIFIAAWVDGGGFRQKEEPWSERKETEAVQCGCISGMYRAAGVRVARKHGAAHANALRLHPTHVWKQVRVQRIRPHRPLVHLRSSPNNIIWRKRSVRNHIFWCCGIQNFWK